MRFLAFAILTLVCVGARVASAEDRKRIALRDFEGPQNVSVRGDIMRIAAARAWVTSAAKLEGRSVREFADDYELDLVIEGVVERRGQGYEIRIYFVRGTTGRSMKSVTLPVPRPALDVTPKKRVERELVRILASIPARASDADTTPRAARTAP